MSGDPIWVFWVIWDEPLPFGGLHITTSPRECLGLGWNTGKLWRGPILDWAKGVHGMGYQ